MFYDASPTPIAALIRTRRLERGFSQRRVAEELGVSEAYVSMLESGEKIPSAELLTKLSAALSYPPDQITLLSGRFPPDIAPLPPERLPHVTAILREEEAKYQMQRLFNDEPSPCEPVASPANLSGPHFSGELIGAKNSVIYNAHSYHTKIPPEAVRPLVEHYSSPGDRVLDPFCGSGMTGVAALLAGRGAILSDLSPAAVHIASNYCTPCNAQDLDGAAKRALQAARPTVDWLYESDDGISTIEYVLWSDVFSCPWCEEPVSYWKSTFDPERRVLKRLSTCTYCGKEFRKDAASWLGEEPVLVSLSSGNGRGARRQRPATARELSHLAAINATPIATWYPQDRFGPEREMWRASHRAMGITAVDKFFTHRNLFALSELHHRIRQEPDARLMRALMFAFTGCVNRASKRYQWNAKRPTNVMTGTLYVSSLRYEFNVASLFSRKVAAVERYYAALGNPAVQCEVRQCSATNLQYLGDGTADYVFTDPPFGSNIYYADSSLLWEAWLGRFTDERLEAVVNRKRTVDVGGKDLDGYGNLMTQAFCEIHRVLKPGRFASVVFNNTDGRIWQAIQSAVADAGFSIASTSGLDKTHRSIKGIKGTQGREQVAVFDVVLNLERTKSFNVAVPHSDERAIDETLRAVFVEHLRARKEGSTEVNDNQRTDYFHSLAVRALLERKLPLKVLSFQDVERILASIAVSRNGEWALRDEERRDPLDISAGSPYGSAIALDLADISAFVRDAKVGSEKSEPPQIDALPAEVRGSRNTAVYNAHSYPTKVPPEAIVPFIERFSRPGDLVLDPFSGSGMTGVAASLTGRRAVLNDLSPLAAHLAFNHTRPCDPVALADVFAELYQRLRPEFAQMYWAAADDKQASLTREPGYVHYTLWSVEYECPACGKDFRLWDAAVDRASGHVSSRFPCPFCAAMLSKARLDVVGSAPVLVSVQLPDGKRVDRAPTAEELEEIARIEARPIDDWFPDLPFPQDCEMYIRSALHLQHISRIGDFYTPRNLRALARLWREIASVKDYRVLRALQFAFTNTAWHGTKMRRYNALGGQRPLTGTLYIPQLSSEVNVLEVMKNKVHQLLSFYGQYKPMEPFVAPALRVGSATDLFEIADESIDYAFFDPPFGANIFYSDLNYLLEAWLGVLTRSEQEAVVNRSLPVKRGGKTLDDYEFLMSQALKETHRVLKAGHAASMVFHNTDPEVWRALQRAIEGSGFVVLGASGLNRAELSMKGYKGLSDLENVAHHDLIIHLERSGRVATLGPRMAEEMIIQILTEHLARADGQVGIRTTQYLHSLVLRHLVGNEHDVGDVSYAYVKGLCATHFDPQEDGWCLRGGVDAAPRARFTRSSLFDLPKTTSRAWPA